MNTSSSRYDPLALPVVDADQVSSPGRWLQGLSTETAAATINLRLARAECDQFIRGSADERRSAWESACLAAAGAMIHRQQVRERGYSRPAPISRPFRVC